MYEEDISPHAYQARLHLSTHCPQSSRTSLALSNTITRQKAKRGSHPAPAYGLPGLPLPRPGIHQPVFFPKQKEAHSYIQIDRVPSSKRAKKKLVTTRVELATLA
jgi:hypothetical protein